MNPTKKKLVKAATGNFCCLLILAAPVGKSDMHTTASCYKDLDLASPTLFLLKRKTAACRM